MNKIPVAETISGAYGFAFGNILSVLGIVWFPWVLMMAIMVAAIYGVAPGLPGHLARSEFGTPLFFEIGRVFGIVGLASMVIGAMVRVGLQQKALGLLKGPTFIYFSLAAPVWRMIGANILAALVLVFIYVLTALAAAAISVAAVKFIPHVGMVIAVVTVIAAALWFIYACVRLLFFLPAVVVAEERIGLGRSWELGGGNFWRMFAVAFVVFVPVAIGLQIAQSALLGSFAMQQDFAQRIRANPHITPAELWPIYMTMLATVLKRMWDVWPAILALGTVQSLLYSGLLNGMIAKAYLGVTSPKSAMPGTEGAA